MPKWRTGDEAGAPPRPMSAGFAARKGRRHPSCRPVRSPPCWRWRGIRHASRPLPSSLARSFWRMRPLSPRRCRHRMGHCPSRWRWPRCMPGSSWAIWACTASGGCRRGFHGSSAACRRTGRRRSGPGFPGACSGSSWSAASCPGCACRPIPPAASSAPICASSPRRRSVATLCWTSLLFGVSLKVGQFLMDHFGAWRWAGAAGFVVFIIVAGRARGRGRAGGAAMRLETAVSAAAGRRRRRRRVVLRVLAGLAVLRPRGGAMDAAGPAATATSACRPRPTRGLPPAACAASRNWRSCDMVGAAGARLRRATACGDHRRPAIRRARRRRMQAAGLALSGGGQAGYRLQRHRRAAGARPRGAGGGYLAAFPRGVDRGAAAIHVDGSRRGRDFLHPAPG